MTYQPAVYREQGGDKLIVASSGELEVQSGGYVDIQSGGYIQLPRVARTTADVTALPKCCIAILTGSSTGPTVPLAAPQTGAWVHAKCIGVGASGNIKLSSTADITSGKNRLKFDAIDEAVTLAATSTGWHVVSNVGSVASTSG